jgi:hypothetical protein
MKSSFHSLISFLPLFCNFQFRRLDWVQFLYSQAHIPAGWRLETRTLHWTTSFEIFFMTTLHGPRRKHSLYEGVFTAPFNSNWSYSCLRIHCCGNVFTELLPRNERLFWLRYSGFRVSWHNIKWQLCSVLTIFFWGINFAAVENLKYTYCMQILFCTDTYLPYIRNANFSLYLAYCHLEWPLVEHGAPKQINIERKIFSLFSLVSTWISKFSWRKVLLI